LTKLLKREQSKKVVAWAEVLIIKEACYKGTTKKEIEGKRKKEKKGKTEKKE
jgi:hypothetical protein